MADPNDATLPPVVPPDPDATLPPVGEAAQATLPPTEPAQQAALPHGWDSPPGYEILGELGRGGMGVVYKAKQAKLDRIVALKMILAGGHAGAAELARFKAEAEVIGRLQHPGIVQIFEVGEYEGRPYFSLEFCSGGSLDNNLSGRPQPPRDAAALVERLAQAVQAAHEKGVIHRDLKPANVLLCSDGSLKITDFGLARKVEGGGATATGAVMGTPSYMAPEQAEGKKDVGPLADVYALGALLYECLTGRPPFRAATALDTILQAVTEEPVPPRQLNAQVPRDLETIALKCLQKDPGRRYATAADLKEDLRRFLAGEPIRARPIGRGERLVKWCRRRPAVAALSAALVTLALAAFATVTAALIAADAQRRRAEQRGAELQEKTEKLTESEQAQREVSEALARSSYASGIALAQQLWLAGNPAQARDALDRTPVELRNWEWHYLDRQFRAATFTRIDSAGLLTSLGGSPNGKTALAATLNLSQQSLVPSDENIRCQINVLNPADGTWKPLHWPEGRKFTTTRFAFSSLGDRFAALEQGGKTVQTFRLSDGKPEKLIESGDNTIAAIGYGQYGRLLAVTPVLNKEAKGDPNSLYSRIVVNELPSFRQVATIDWPKLPAEVGAVHTLALSPDGKRLAGMFFYFPLQGGVNRAKAFEGKLLVWDVGSKQPPREYTGSANEMALPAFSPDGRWLAWGDQQRVMLADQNERKEPRILTGHAAEVTEVAFAPGGKALASASKDGTVRIWELATGDSLRVFRGHSAQPVLLAFAGDRLLSGGITRDSRTEIKGWNWQNDPECRTILIGTYGERTECVALDSARKNFAFGREDAFSIQGADGKSSLVCRGDEERVASRITEYSPDGKLLAYVAKGSGPNEKGPHRVILADASSGKFLAQLELPPMPDDDSIHYASRLAFSPDGTRLVYCCFEDRCREAKAGKQEPGLQNLSLFARIWDVASRREQRTIRKPLAADRKIRDVGRGIGEYPYVAGAAFNAAGDLLALAAVDRWSEPEGAWRQRGVILVWDVAKDEQRLLRIGPLLPDAIAFSGVSDDVAIAGEEARQGRMLLLDARGNRDRWTKNLFGTKPASVTFTPDGQRIAAGGVNGNIDLRDARSGQELLTLSGHRRPVTRLKFTPDGRELISASGFLGDLISMGGHGEASRLLPAAVKIWQGQ